MTTPFEDFDALSDATPSHSGTFKLGGRVWKIRHRDDVPFEIVRRLMGSAPSGANATEEEQAASAREVVLQTGPFFAATIALDEVDDFMKMFSDEKSALTLGKLKPVMEYVSKVVFTEDEQQAPYETVQALLAWAVGNWSYVRGKLLLAGHTTDSIRRLSVCGVVDLTYTIRLDWALESDRMGAMLGAETTFVDDFLKEIEAPDEEVESESQNNITDLRAWVNEVNSKMSMGK